jgi:MtrB/PioB family decaheme-associated outer membrane protein
LIHLRLLFVLFLSGIPTVPALAASGNLDLRLLHLDDDGTHFGQYEDVVKTGAAIAIDLDVLAVWQDRRWHLTAKEVGLETYDIEFGLRGDRWQVQLVMDGNLQYREQSGLSPFRDSGENLLALPEGWVPGIDTSRFSGLTDTLRSIELRSERDRLALNLDYRINDRWSLQVGYQYEDRSGRRATGASIYYDASTNFAVILPVPEDSDSTHFDMGLNYTNDNLTTTLTWQQVKFDNHHELQLWQNPYSATGNLRVDFPNGVGGLSGSPDHDFQSVTLQGAFRSTRIAGLNLQWQFAWSETDADDPRPGFSANELILATQTPQFGNSVRQHRARLKAVYRPRGLRRVTLRASIQWHDRDQDKPRSALNYVRGDAVDQGSDNLAIYSNNYNYDITTLGLGADVRLPWHHGRLSIDYEFEENEKQFVSVSEIETDKLKGVLRLRPAEELNVMAEVTLGNRSTSEYQWQNSFLFNRSTAFIEATPEELRYDNHPSFSQYHLAASDSERTRLSVAWTGWRNWTATLDAAREHIDYDDTDLGLRESDWQIVSVDLSYALSEVMSAYLHGSISTFEAETSGRSFSGGIEKAPGRNTPPLPQASDPAYNWRAVTDDEVRSITAGVQWQISDACRLDIDWTQVDTDATWQQATGRSISELPLPDVKTRLNTWRATLAYQFSASDQLELSYENYRFSDDDFALQNVNPASISNVLWTGVQPDDEDLNIVTLSWQHRLGGE